MSLRDVVFAVVAFGAGCGAGYIGLGLLPSLEDDPSTGQAPPHDREKPTVRCNCAPARARATAQVFETCNLRVYLAGTADPFPEPTQADVEQASQRLDELLESCPDLLGGARVELLCDELPCLAVLEQANATLDRDPEMVDRCNGLRVGYVTFASRDGATKWLKPLLPPGWPPPDQRERWHRRWRSRQLLLSDTPP
jgi:hypothetical protein